MKSIIYSLFRFTEKYVNGIVYLDMLEKWGLPQRDEIHAFNKKLHHTTLV